LTLPDGTRVWLNAASSLTYPTSFSGNERRVSVTGEAYFEVAHNQQLPFRVSVNNRTTIEVLGTHFNVNAYSDEASISTTLLEGKVKVMAGKKFQMLSPGQQAQVSASMDLRWNKNADLRETIAWKNGAFSFNQADLPTVLRQLSRWYNIQVEYLGKIPEAKFTGEIGRSLTLDQVLKGLAKTRINYRIETGNKLLIMP